MPYGRITLLLAMGVSTATAAPRAADAPAAESGAAPTDALPTRTEMDESFEAGDYPRTLQQVARALAVKADAAGDYDRYDLLILKAEAHLRLKNTAAAAAAFDEAAKSAAHAKGVAVGTVSAELVRRSRNLQYTPSPQKKEKGAAAAAGPADPIDITDADGRARAFTAMLEDAKGKVVAEVKAAKAAATLAPIVDALAMLRDLRLLELAAEDESGAAAEMAAGLAERARALAERPVQQMAEQVAKVEEAASREYTDYTPRRNAGGRVTRVTSGVTGPTAPQSAELRRIVAECRGIHESIARIAVVLAGRPDARRGAKGGGAKGGGDQDAGVLGGAVLDELAAVAKDADAVRNRAQEVLRLAYAPADGYDVYEEDERAFREQYNRPGTNTVRRPVRGGRPGSTGAR